jgi:asparagine synthase (glutamine-hydrolysing)
MCGICGIINADRSNAVDKKELIRIRDTMSHRGPDDKGIYISGGVGLAHLRLSIIDVEGGHQPICNEDKSIWCVYNGEIYNYQSVRDRLVRNGHKFATNTDTEILVHLYEEDGTEFLSKLQGMFAFVIWDSNKDKIFAARDRLGIKPFYYSIHLNRFIFASEIKAILQCERFKKIANIDCIPEYLIFRFIAGDKTFIKGIYSLLPGHWLVWDHQKLTINQYWSIYDRRPEMSGYTQTEILRKLDHLLSTSVERRLISDVPLGTLNSGGVDSSIVTAYASEMKNEPVNSFSVGFEDLEYDESYYASIVSDKFGTNHHSLILSQEKFAEYLPLCIWYNDEPLNHANSVPIYLICRLAKRYVSVILSGEGADEIFGGYPRYWLFMLQDLFPLIIRRALMIGVSKIPGHYASKLRNYLPMSDYDALLLNSAFVLPSSIKDLLGYKSKCTFSPYRESVIDFASRHAETFVDKGLCLDIHTYLISILQRKDRMSMAAGVEARVPFLDHELVEFGMSLPCHYKLSLRNLRTKSILKSLASKKLPNEIINRKKSGFGIPINKWLINRNGLRPFINLLFDKRFEERGIFNQRKIKNIVNEHLAGKVDHSDLLWPLINLELWFQIFIDKNGCESDAKILSKEFMDAKAYYAN